MSELSASVKALGDTLKELPYEDRERELRKLQLIVAAGAPKDELEEPPPIRELGEYMENPPPVPPELITPKFLVRGGVTVTVARAGIGKTSVLLNRIIPWSAGLPMFGKLHTAFVPTQPLRILIIENEGAGGEFYRKMQRLLDSSNLTDEQKELALKNILIWGEGGYAGVRLDDDKSLKTVRRGIKEWEPDAVLLEPFARLHHGNENDNSEMNRLGSVLEELAVDYNCGIMLAHHEGKSHRDSDEPMDRQRGASALEGFVTYMEILQSVKGGAQRELVSVKSRYAEKPSPVRLEWRGDEWYDYVAPEKGVQEVLDLLNPETPSFIVDIAEDLEEPQHRIRILLRKAEADGQVKKLPGMSNGAGSTGNGWLLRTAENANAGEGVSF